MPKLLKQCKFSINVAKCSLNDANCSLHDVKYSRNDAGALLEHGGHDGARDRAAGEEWLLRRAAGELSLERIVLLTLLECAPASH